MKQLWTRYAERIDAFSLRERVLLFSAAMAVLLGLLYSVLLEPQVRAEQRLSSTIAQKRAEAKNIEDQLTKIATSRAADPDKPRRDRLAQVRAELAAIEAQIRLEERKFTAPEQMKAVVDEMLARNRAVQLVSMKTLASTTLAEARGEKPAPKPAAKPGVPGATPGERLIYRHGLEVIVSGTYGDLLRYLADLERLPTQLYWSSLELDAARYPRHTMKLVVYTLSLDPAWLNV